MQYFQLFLRLLHKLAKLESGLTVWHIAVQLLCLGCLLLRSCLWTFSKRICIQRLWPAWYSAACSRFDCNLPATWYTTHGDRCLYMADTHAAQSLFDTVWNVTNHVVLLMCKQSWTETKMTSTQVVDCYIKATASDVVPHTKGIGPLVKTQDCV